MKWGLYIRYLKDFVFIGALMMTGLYKPGTRHFFLRKNKHQEIQGPGPSSESVGRELHIRLKFLFSNLDFQDTLFPHPTPRWSGFVAGKSDIESVYKKQQRIAIVPDLKIYVDSTEMIKEEGNTQNQAKAQTQQHSSTKEYFA